MRRHTEKYYFVWVEGFEPKTGEKIKRFDNDGSIVYTCSMMKAMRVKKEDAAAVEEKMRRLGIASFVMDSPNTFMPTSYAPKGTVYGSKEHETILLNKR